MEYLHSQKIFHRDIKPANIFIKENNVLKLGDFGCARMLKETEEFACTFAGTIVYMAPEILQNTSKGYNELTDIWSLGVTFYELIMRKKLFTTNAQSTKDDVLKQIQNKKLVQKKIQEIGKHYGKESILISLLQNILKVDWKERYKPHQIIEVINN